MPDIVTGPVATADGFGLAADTVALAPPASTSAASAAPASAASLATLSRFIAHLPALRAAFPAGLAGGAVIVAAGGPLVIEAAWGTVVAASFAAGFVAAADGRPGHGLGRRRGPPRGRGRFGSSAHAEFGGELIPIARSGRRLGAALLPGLLRGRLRPRRGGPLRLLRRRGAERVGQRGPGIVILIGHGAGALRAGWWSGDGRRPSCDADNTAENTRILPRRAGSAGDRPNRPSRGDLAGHHQAAGEAVRAASA